jgi:hypothetical protein
MARQRVPSGEEILRLLRSEAGQGRYGYAPGRLSLEGLRAQLAIAGTARAPHGPALRQAIERLIAEGKVRAVEVVGPDGRPGGDWYEAVEAP